MPPLFVILCLTLLQFVTGFGLLTLFNTRLKPSFFLALSIIMGIAVFSVIPFILQLFYIPITASNVFLSLTLACLLLNVQLPKGIRQFRHMMEKASFRLKLYELPFLAIIILILFVSIWRCFYFPPTPADATSGAEVVAEYTIREKTMINSAFLVARNGNSLKPPFLTCMQIIYKLAGIPLGQVWLSNIFVCFIIILYNILNTKLHRIITGLLILLFLAIPEMYAYTFMMLYDYSNAVFFFLSIYFLVSFFKHKQSNELAFAGMLMGIATYLRPETPALLTLLIPAIIWHQVKHKAGVIKTITVVFVFSLPTLIFYLLSVTLYISVYLPLQYSVAAQINPRLTSIHALWKHFAATNSKIIFSSTGINHYGYFIFIFLGLLILEVAWKRRLNAIAANFLYATLVVYLAYPTLSHALPGLSIEHSVKRGFFKLFPLMLLYMSNNWLLTTLSERISRWENVPEPIPVSTH